MNGLRASARDFALAWAPAPALEFWRRFRWRLALSRAAKSQEVPAFADFVGYDTLVAFMRDHRVCELPGDFIEIGAFLGGGTAKLAKFAGSCRKQVWVIDIFDPAFDRTETIDGEIMSDMYQRFLHYASQEQIFRRVTGPYRKKLRVLKGDSRRVRVPDRCRFCFGFIDGNHHPLWVINDFLLVWDRLVPGGWVGFHDYGGDLPLVTAAIDLIAKACRDSIDDVVRIKEKTVILLRKNSLRDGEVESHAA
jgi:SAM-dependent methyltransferase